MTATLLEPVPRVAPAAPPRRITADELEAMPGGERFELIDGQLKEKQVGHESSWVGGEIQGVLREFARRTKLGVVNPPDTQFRCFGRDRDRVRLPDVSFIRLDRLPDGRLFRGMVTVAPDLAVEVVSPNDLVDEIDNKILEYLRVGVQLVWVVHPIARTVHVHRADGSTIVLRDTDTLDGGDVLPGFAVKVGELFPPPELAAIHPPLPSDE